MNKISIYPGYNYRSVNNKQRFNLFITSLLFGIGCVMLFIHASYFFSFLFFLASIIYFMRFITVSVKSIAGLKKRCCYYKVDQFNIRIKKWHFASEELIKWSDVEFVQIKKYKNVSFRLRHSNGKCLRLSHLSYKRRYAIISTIAYVAKELCINIEYTD